MTQRWIIFFALGLIPSVDSSLAAQPSTAKQHTDETAPTFVLRVSRPFLSQLSEVSFTHDDPVNEFILGSHVVGTSHVDGKFALGLQTSAELEAIQLHIKGRVSCRTTATSRGVDAHCSGEGTFDATRPVSFDGKAFVGGPVRVDVNYRARLEGISFHRPRLFDGLARRIAYRAASNNLPTGESIARSELQQRIASSVLTKSDEMLKALNRVTEVAVNANDPAKKRPPVAEGKLELKLAASDDYLLLGVAGKAQHLTELPELPADERAPVEVWLPRPDTEKKIDLLSALRTCWPAMKTMLQVSTLSGPVPDVTKVLNNVYVTDLADWHVVRLYFEADKIR